MKQDSQDMVVTEARLANTEGDIADRREHTTPGADFEVVG